MRAGRRCRLWSGLLPGQARSHRVDSRAASWVREALSCNAKPVELARLSPVDTTDVYRDTGDVGEKTVPREGDSSHWLVTVWTRRIPSSYVTSRTSNPNFGGSIRTR